MKTDLKNLTRRFWPKVRIQRGCWEWLACKVQGYGRLGIGRSGSTMAAHRLSWIIHNGPIRSALFVLHSCDNPGCVNPSHLFLGTQRDNLYDMTKKGRGKPYGAKLSKQKATEIRKLRGLGLTQQSIADRFGVLQSTVSKICLKKTYYL